MLDFLTRLFLCVALAGLLPPAWGASGTAGRNSGAATQGTKKQLSVIVFAGLAGAILGLSTLSFYGRPQDKLNNIAIGAAVGIIGGTIYTTFKAATEPRDFYEGLRPARDFNLLAMNRPDPRALSERSPTLKFDFSF